MRITVLGMGRMGRALALRLLDTDNDVTVWNRTPGRASEVVARGAAEAADAEGAVTGAEVVLTMLTADAAVQDVLLPGGHPRPLDGDIVDCSTVAPATTRSLAAAYGDRFGACPVLGGPAAVEAGEATLVVAGPAALRRRVQPALASLSSSIREVGDDAANASVVKLLANYMLLGGLAILAEAVAAGQAAGLDDQLLIALFEQAAAPSLRSRVADVVRGDHDGWFPTPMGAKDMRLLVGAAEDRGTALPIARLVASRFDEAAASGWADRDVAAVVELLRHH
ncbi:MAG: NAD(P)-dependent oxidoreductase [Acidimicrobiales bacterium]